MARQEIAEAEQRLRDWHSELSASTESVSNLSECLELERSRSAALERELHQREEELQSAHRRVRSLRSGQTSLLRLLSEVAHALPALREELSNAKELVTRRSDQTKAHCRCVLSAFASSASERERHCNQLSARVAELEQALASSELQQSQLHAQFESEAFERSRAEHEARSLFHHWSLAFVALVHVTFGTCIRLKLSGQPRKTRSSGSGRSTRRTCSLCSAS